MDRAPAPGLAVRREPLAEDARDDDGQEEVRRDRGISAKKIPLLREQLDRIKRNLDADAIPDAALPRGAVAQARRRVSLREARYKG